MRNSNRIEILDLIRFLSAFSVVLYHYLYRGWRSDNLSDVDFNFYDGFFKYGYLGVQVFFIISGFVIYLSIDRRNIKQFIISRFSRLYPTYWMCLSITLLFVFLLDDGRFFVGLSNSILNYLMFSKIFGVPFVDGAYWTLIYELAFYFWVFISLFLKRDFLVQILFFFSLLSMSFILLGINENYSVFWCGSFVGYFLVGAIFYRIYKRDYSYCFFVYLIFGFFLCYLQAYFQVDKKNHIPGVNLDYSTVFIILNVVFLFFFLISIRLFDSFQSKTFWHLGIMTFPCYLLHQNIGYILFNFYGESMSPWIILLVVSFVLLLISYLIGRFFEPYAIRKSKKILGGIL